MAEDGVLKMGGAELGRRFAAALLRFANGGSGAHNLAKVVSRLQRGSRKESLGWLDIPDEMEVERKDVMCYCVTNVMGQPIH